MCTYYNHYCKMGPPHFWHGEMAESTRDLAIYLMESAVRCYHIFKRIWTPVVGNVLYALNKKYVLI